MAENLTPAEAAAELNVSEWFLRQGARDKRFPHLRASRRRILFSRDQLEEINERMKVEAMTGPAESQASPGLPSTRSRRHRRFA